MMALSDGKKNFEDICNRLDTIPACDGRKTDGQTNIRTSCDGALKMRKWKMQEWKIRE